MLGRAERERKRGKEMPQNRVCCMAGQKLLARAIECIAETPTFLSFGLFQLVFRLLAGLVVGWGLDVLLYCSVRDLYPSVGGEKRGEREPGPG